MPVLSNLYRFGVGEIHIVHENHGIGNISGLIANVQGAKKDYLKNKICRKGFALCAHRANGYLGTKISSALIKAYQKLSKLRRNQNGKGQSQSKRCNCRHGRRVVTSSMQCVRLEQDMHFSPDTKVWQKLI